MDAERFLTKAFAYAFLVFAIVIAVVVLVKGAWWHVFTVVASYFFYRSLKDELEKTT